MNHYHNERDNHGRNNEPEHGDPAFGIGEFDGEDLVHTDTPHSNTAASDVPVSDAAVSGVPEPVLLPEPIEIEDYEGCEYCVGGFNPVAVHPVLGPVYTACPYCQDQCGCCAGIGLFPATITCPDCLVDALAVYGLTVRFCHTCAGVLTVEGREVTR